jgi:hypothetical protein
LSGFDVPDDDMPHNQPLTWNPVFRGSLPYDERDLEAVLSGNTDGIAIGLHAVAKGLAPLRGGPRPAELAGEDAARAAFRAFMVVGAAEPGAVDLPHLRPAGAPHRHRRPRSASRIGGASRIGASRIGASRTGAGRASLRLGAGVGAGAGFGVLKVVGAAVAAAVVVGFAVSGALSGTSVPGGKQHPVVTATGLAQASGGGSTQHVEGGGEASHPAVNPTPAPGSTPAGAVPGAGAAQPTVSGTATRPARKARGGKAAEGATVCKEFFSFVPLHASAAAWAAHSKQGWELVALAGGPWNVLAYCKPYVGSLSLSWPQWPGAGSTPSASAGWPGAGSGSAPSSGTGQGGQGRTDGSTGADNADNSGNSGNSGNPGRTGRSTTAGTSSKAGRPGGTGSRDFPGTGSPGAGPPGTWP